jgi:hypothetical protein
MKIRILTILLCCCTLFGCTKPEETTGKATADIGLRIYAEVTSEEISYVSVIMWDANADDPLRLGDKDRLFLFLDDRQLVIPETISRGNLYLPEDNYYYILTLEEDISTRNVKVKLDRSQHESSTNTVAFGDPPEILTPLPGTRFSYSNDEVVVAIQPDNATASRLTFGDFLCRRSETFEGNDVSTTTVTLVAEQGESCTGESNIYARRIWESPPDSVLRQQASYIEARLTRSVTVHYDP